MKSRVLACFLLLLAGCRDREAVRFHPLNPERYHNPDWERMRAEYLAVKERAAAGAPDGDAKEPAPQSPLSLEQAIRYALAHAPAVTAAVLEQRKAEGRVVSARSAARPTLSLSGSYLRLNEVSTIDVPPLGSITLGALDNYRVAVSLAQPLYVGGKTSAALRLARHYESLVAHSRRAAELATAFGTTSAYYRVVLAQKRLALLEEQLRLSRRHLEDAEQRHSAGAALALHVMRARAALSTAESGLIAARNGLDTARRDFLLTIGAPVDAAVTLGNDLPQEATEAAPEPPALDTLRTSRPDIAIIEARIRMQQENLNIVAGDAKPVIAAFGDFAYEKPSSKDLTDTGWSDYWQAGLRLSWTLFDGGAVQGRLIEERAALRQMQDELAIALRTARKEVLEAIAGIDASAKLVGANANALQQAREALRLAQAGFEAGTATQTELLDAQAAVTAAGLQYAEALFSHTMAWASYRLAVGSPAIAERSN